jgi:hypothetical protein
MRKLYTFFSIGSIAVFLTLFSLFPISCEAYGIKYKTSGNYVDSAGNQHVWNVNEAHTLIWDGDAYIPVGGAFTSRYITDATEANYQADITDLDVVKAQGITDIILKAQGPITSADPTALQKVIDYLDANGFNYGIEMDDGPSAPLSGFLISPNRYRLEGPWDQRTITCSWPDVDSAIYLVVSQFDNTIIDRGGAIVIGGKTTITLREPLRSGQILIVYPHKTFKPASEGGMADLWGGFAEYRDRVIGFFDKVKFGPGLRFFLEPFTSKMDFTGDMISFLPDSSGFRLGLEAYLTKKYQHEGGVNSAWGMNDNLDTIEAAARLIPLWASGRGMPYAYDRASAGLYSIDATVTGMWRDIVDYRDSSAQEYMNTISDILHKKCANVPVIFKSDRYHRIYANPFGIGGSDGLGAEAIGVGETPITDVAGPLYSLAEESGKTTWFIASELGNKPGDADNVSRMVGTADLFREIGCKGFFANSLDDTQTQWLKSFKDKLHTDNIIDFQPTVIGYPVSITTGAFVKRLMPNTWWLPTLKTGKTSYIGDGLFAYTLAGEDRSYIWSGVGEQTITLKVPPTGVPSIVFPSDSQIGGRKNIFTVPLKDHVPTIVKGMDFSLIFPYETAQAQVDRLAALIPEADKAGIGVQKPRDNLSRCKDLMKNGQYMQAWDMARSSINELLQQLGADVWLEGEQVRSENFNNIVPTPGASSALALVLDTDEDAPLAPYSVSFTADTQTNASYEIWLAGTPPDEGSPMSYTVDDVNWAPVAAEGKRVETYTDGLAWYKIGTINLYPGKHIIRLRADGKRSSDNRYYFAVDALVLSPRGFTPKGVIKPY